MSKRTQPGTADSLVQPRLSRVLTHLQPNQLEYIYGTDAQRVSQVHGLLGQSAPLLILGDDAMGRIELARSLIVQLVTMNDPAHLRLALLERTPTLSPLLRGIPHTSVVAAELHALLPVLIETGAQVVHASWRSPGAGKPPWVVVVHELRDHLLDANTVLSLRSLIEYGLDWGFHVIALSQRGDPELNLLFQSRVAFRARGGLLRRGNAIGSTRE